MQIRKTEKLFGIGPLGALVSSVLLALFWWVDHILGHTSIMAHPAPLKYAAAMLIIIGLGLHFWTLYTLRNWWKDDRLCITGPFKYFRHPMYAAWITFISSGIALFLNSWILLLWVAALHPIWHLLITKEEKMMAENFGDEYREYAAGTGRFFPRIFYR